MAALRNTIRSLDDGTFLERAREARPGAFMRLQFEAPGRTNEEAAARACNGCFLDLARALVNFLDRMVALKRCLGQTISLPPMGSTEEARAFLDGVIEDAYQRVARDQTLSNPKKLAEFPKIPDSHRRAVESYFALRRCLEHHSGVPNVALNLYSMKMVFVAGDQEIASLPYTAPENTAIGMRVGESVWTFLACKPVVLSEEQVEGVALTLQMWVGPAIAQAL